MLTDLQRLNGIIADLKTATEPDRELDVMIAVAVDWRAPEHETHLLTARNIADRHGMTWLVANEGNPGSVWKNIPAYTSSYDAAFSLANAEPNRRAECGTYGDGTGWAYAHLGQPVEVVGEADGCPNEPTALTLAFLRCHAARLEAQAEEAA
jgi:hypothetical protein